MTISTLSKARFARFQSTDALLGAFVALVVALLIVPLPAWLLDLLLAANLSLSVSIVLATLYASKALELSVFPSLLLLTTLLRLGLNVASTRLILLDGYAGEVIGSFGEFAVGGNYAVGAIVFLVLCVIQFIVIAKGSERVAEVGARFVLDAMPGKQMAIDAELRGGTIDNATAKSKRISLERECQFYGAMDGAMKFVKGDVIAGFIIVVVNFVFGIGLGVTQRGMSLTSALEKFGLLTVGDGLVAQIPSMILAVSAGVLVTRVGSDGEPRSLSFDFASQIFGNSRSLYVAGGFVALLGLLPGLPNFAFMVVGCSLLAIAFLRERQILSRAPTLQSSIMRATEIGPVLPMVEPWTIRVGSGFLLGEAPTSSRLLSSQEVPPLARSVEGLKSRLFRELGVQIPACRFEWSPELNADEVSLEIREMTLLRKVVHQSEALELLDFESKLYKVLRRNAGQFLGLASTQSLLDALELVDSVTVRQVVPRLVSLPQLNEVLRSLVDEGVSIRDLSGILTALGRIAQTEKDPHRLVEAVREAQKDALCYQLAGGSGQLRVIVLDPTLEDMIRMGVSKNGGAQNLVMSASALSDVVTSLTRAVEEAKGLGAGDPQAILVAPEIRRHTRKLIESVLPDIAVLSYGELLSDMVLATMATASLFGIDSD